MMSKTIASTKPFIAFFINLKNFTIREVSNVSKIAKKNEKVFLSQ